MEIPNKNGVLDIVDEMGRPRNTQIVTMVKSGGIIMKLTLVQLLLREVGEDHRGYL